jgi:hypothetical protein
MSGFAQETSYQAFSNNQTKLPPVNPVTPATASTVPDSGTTSASLNPGVTAALVGSVAAHAAATSPVVTSTGSGVITDSTGKINAAVGALAQTPQQLEAAGILKPGSAALITGLVQRGSNVEAAMTKNLFTGTPGAENLLSLAKSIKAQTTAQVANFQQAQTAMTITGAITGKEQPGVIAGIINAASQVGVQATAAYLQTSTNATTVTAAAAGLSSMSNMQSSSKSGVPLSKSGGTSAGSGSISVGAAYATSSSTGTPLSANRKIGSMTTGIGGAI